MRRPNVFSFFCFVFVWKTALLAAFDSLENSIIGVPKVLCEENDLAVDIVTARPFEGNIFVKGRSRDTTCRQTYGRNASSSYSLPLGKCGMQRLRSANPRGVSFVVTLIVSFHPAGFITKHDRAFHVKCFYLEPDEKVTAALEVSQLATTELADQMQMPKCEYSVHRDSQHGPPLTFAQVGETVFHVWQCAGGGASMGMLVKQCFVTDGDGEDHLVVDADGCSTDAWLLGSLVYEPSLSKAWAPSQVFKYADSNQLYFTCQIRLCHKEQDACATVTPPSCDRRKAASVAVATGAGGLQLSSSASARSKRSPPSDDALEVDVATRELLVVAADDADIDGTPLCVSRSALPLLPIAGITLAFGSAALALLAARCAYARRNKSSSFFL